MKAIEALCRRISRTIATIPSPERQLTLFTRKLTSLIAVVAVAAGISAGGAAFAGMANAATIDSDIIWLTSGGFAFGGADPDIGYDGTPDQPGEVYWNYSGGQLSVHVVGLLHLDSVVGWCARMRVDYFDVDDDMLATRYGGTVCAPDNEHHWWAVDLNPSYASADIAEVKVSIEKQTSLGGSFLIGDSVTLSPYTYSDSVDIYATGFDFGGDSWLSLTSRPFNHGYVSWGLEGGKLTPHVTGTLHLNNVNGGCARINIRYLSELGAFLTDRAGGTVCAYDNDHHEFTVDLDPYTSNKIGQVTVQLQVENTNGTWTIVGSDTKSVAIDS